MHMMKTNISDFSNTLCCNLSYRYILTSHSSDLKILIKVYFT